MKYFIGIVIGCSITALILIPLFSKKLSSRITDRSVMEVIHTGAIVKTTLDKRCGSLTKKLSAVADIIAADRDFSMKLIVENDRSAPEISDIASLYIEPMNLSILEITDSNYVILSSGHFPASVGNSVAEKGSILTDSALCLSDNIKGKDTLTFQAKITFTIADQTMYCIGGYIIDEPFIEDIRPRQGVSLLLKYDGEISGMDNIETISAITDNTIIINDTTYCATKISLPYSGDRAPPEIIITIDMPQRPSLLSLL
jgi:hypothetical protein